MDVKKSLKKHKGSQLRQKDKNFTKERFCAPTSKPEGRLQNPKKFLTEALWQELQNYAR